jgi:hypothetical protein
MSIKTASMLKVIFLFNLLMLLSCDNNKTNKEPHIQSQVTNPDSTHTTADTVKKPERDIQSKSPYIRFTKKTPIDILDIKKEFDTTSNFFKSYKEKCDSWKLTKQDALNIFLSSTEIDGQEFHHYYDVLPCYYSGEINIDGKLASYKINAGAFTTIFFKDTSIYLGYKKGDYKKYFLVGSGVD